jgi:4-aminobutyrate aminotransferase / (S)-3-amino-2-methylpropionate transaminase / 5-aminovalerate transaminase
MTQRATTVQDAVGPNTAALVARRQRAVPRGVSNVAPLFVTEASGAILRDADGRRIIDFAGGIGVMNVGHAHPKVVAAITEQARRFTHTCFQVAMYEPYVALAERLNALVPGDWPKKTLFLNSGAEAVENAVKIARAATGRPAVIAFEHAFHGRTLLGLSLTGKVSPYKKGFGPFAPEIYHVPFPYCYRCPENKGRECCRAAPGSLDRQLATLVEAESVAAVVIEPVAGEGGFIPVPAEVLRALAAWCRDHGALLVADEVQTGFGRTGRMFAMEHAGVAADITALAKSLAGGLPLAAVTGRAEVMDAPQSGGLGGTFGGNPVACAAALAVLDVFEEEGLVARAARIGDRVRARFLGWQAKFPWIGDVRGLGAMQGLEIIEGPVSTAPDGKRANAIQTDALRRGLLVLTAGMYGNVIRTLMPLGIGDEHLEEGLAILGAALEEAG